MKLPPQERMIPWVNALLVVALAYVLAQVTWRLVPDAELPPPAVTTGTGAGEAAPARPGLETVARLHLFGTPSAEPARAAAPIDAPETRLNLTLSGVFAADDPKAGSAIIGDGRGQEMFYSTGERLAGGAVLEEVHPDRVILLREGRFETLRLPEASQSGISVDEQSAAPLPGAERVELPELGEYREQIRQEPSRALDLVRMQPVTRNGKIQGYRISPGPEKQLFERSGLQPGDVVTQINGIPLGNPAQMNELFQQLTSAQQLELVVERGGVPQHIVVSLD